MVGTTELIGNPSHMKKYKYYFSLFYFTESVPKQIATFQFFIKNLTSMGAIATYVSSNEHYALLVAGVGYTIDFLGHFIYVEEISDDK